MNKEHIADSFAALFEYPSGSYRAALDATIARSRSEGLTSVYEKLEKFHSEVHELNLTEMEELFTRTFDINPVATLEIGWHIYGEQYERGTFLVQMRSRLRDLNIEEGTELPDHITSALRLLARVKEEEGKLFIERYLAPAVKKIQDGLTKKSNPYRHLVEAMTAMTNVSYVHEEGVEDHV
jgi:nitrate reductase molybdenum cofactor assembly chaperone NarJ/NarW